MAERWAATSASFDNLADAARLRQQSDQPELEKFCTNKGSRCFSAPRSSDRFS